MERFKSAVKNITNSTAASVLGAGRLRLQKQRNATVPEVAVVNNFDPDQRTFLTDTMKGFSLVQKGSGVSVYNTLTVQADYGVTLPGQDAVPVRPIPGQPVLIYPVAGQSPAMNTSFIRSGGAELKRFYPIKYLFRGAPGSVVSS